MRRLGEKKLIAWDEVLDCVPFSLSLPCNFIVEMISFQVGIRTTPSFQHRSLRMCVWKQPEAINFRELQ